MSSPVKPLEPWQREDAQRLNAIFKARSPMSQMAFGAAHEIGNQSMVSQYLLGRRPLNIDAARKFADGLNCAIDEFSPTIAAKIAEASERIEPPEEVDAENDPNLVPVRQIIFRISAGIAGFSIEHLDNGDGEPIFFSRHWIERRGLDPAKLYATRVNGSSMEPRISDGDVVVVNTADVKREKEGLFAFNHEGEFTVKRLKYDHRRWWLVSENPDKQIYPSVECGDSTYVLGRVVHLHREL